jgi:hypothetical protein
VAVSCSTISSHLTRPSLRDGRPLARFRGGEGFEERESKWIRIMNNSDSKRVCLFRGNDNEK